MVTVLAQSKTQINPPRVKIANGEVEGVMDNHSIARFSGIPYAQPPIGELRWKEPQPALDWTGILKADHFRSSPMQKHVFSDMTFRADSISEDCLYLNVWTPSKSHMDKLPVLVYFYGGGFVAGDGSEYRYDGESLAQKGIVTVTINYRLGVFGFLAHPELTKESPHHASGNYGLLDQYAALLWVKKNIAAFGGDPAKITIGGESAGSMSVSAQMASPLSKDLIAGAIGESGAIIKPTGTPISLEQGEQNGLKFAQSAGAASLADLRAMPASQLLDAAAKPDAFRTTAIIDGYFLPKSPADLFAAGAQAHVPLLVGWNSTEVPYMSIMGDETPTPENYGNKIRQLYGADADNIGKLYPGSTQDEVIRSATALASDRFIVFSTWKWADLQAKTGGQPVYGYIFSHPRPATVAVAQGKTQATPLWPGAFHASEIEYALGNLATNKVYAWTPDDYKVSATMEAYFANFIKTGNPNGAGLPDWTPNTAGSPVQRMNINVDTRLEPEAHHDRYLFLDSLFQK